MESQPNHIPPAIEGKADDPETLVSNRRTLEFFLMGGLLGIGLPVAILLGVQAGERTAALVYKAPANLEESWHQGAGR